MTNFQAEPLLGYRVLVAEDNIILALDMKRLLKNAGANVFGPAKTVEAAADLAKTAPLTCAILDVNLGSHLVFPAAHILRERDIGTIFCTGTEICKAYAGTGLKLRFFPNLFNHRI